ncbi:MAG: outer membrane protein assembly factor BamD [Bacteroidales bacterium]|nr:outer membrane protein assembly factor BamD [Bacteroidales bacterium]
MRLQKFIPILVAVCLAAMLASSCKTAYQKVLEGPDADAKYNLAFSFFNSGKYNKAAQLFESVSLVLSGTERDDTVQYYWGLSNYRMSDYVTAEANFTKFIEHFPRSVFAADARFYRIDCLYRATLRYELDQTPTYKAMTAISEYMLEFPDSPHFSTADGMLKELEERLDRKAFENARLYYRMEDYKAAQVALRNVLKDDSENVFREDILYFTAMASYKYADMSVPDKQKERFLVFQDDYYNFIGEYPESRYREELDRLQAKVQKR